MLAPSLWAGVTSGIPIIASASHCRPISYYTRISRRFHFRSCNLYLLAIPTRHSWLRVSTHRPPAPIFYITDNLASTIITFANSAVIVDTSATTTFTNTIATAQAITTFTRGLRILSVFPPHTPGYTEISVVVDQCSNLAIQLFSATPRSLSPSALIGQPIPASLGFQLLACA